MAADPPIPAWLTSLPLAPEYHPSETDFADPIAFISRIEHHAATFGICKIIPPLPKPSKRFVLSNLNRSLSTSTSPASFTTRHQELGSRRRKPPSFSKMWDSGHLYTVDQFEAKSKAFARSHLAGIKEVTPLLIESLFWKAAAAAEKPIYIEYAINVPGSGFSAPDRRKRTRGVDRSEGRTAGSRLSNSPWNLQVIARSPGSLTRFMPDDVPGVTSPMVYIGMMFSWFAWHIEDHELHSLNFLHTGAPKTWYAVPGEHAATLEDIVRMESYGGSLDRLGALSLLGEKTTVLSPEVLVASGVPCCRLVQHPGEYVVTFPRAYHVGFSHGFNCGEAANFATPQWLKVAKEAALRRAAMNLLPMLSHQQLLYLLTMSFISRIPRELLSGVRSSRLRDRQKEEREILVKREFLKDMRNENRLLCALLAKESASYAVLWEPELLPSLFNGSVPFPTSHFLEAKRMSFNVETVKDIDDGEDDLPCGLNVNSGSLACHACGILGYPFMAIVQPSERALKEFLPLNSEDFHQKLQESGSLNLPSSLQSMSETPHARSGFSLFNANSKEFSSDIATVLDMIGEKVSRTVSSEPVESVSGRMIHSSIVSLPLDSVNVDGLGNILSPVEHQSDSFSSLDEDSESAPNKDTKIKWNTSNRFMRPRIFCLQHALEIEELLQSRGGRNLLIICHSDYIKIKAHAISVAEEIGTEFNIKDSPLESASPKDLDLINISIDAEHEELGEDWTSKLGLNLRPSQIKPRKRLPSNQEQLPLALRQIFSVPSPALISNLKWASRKSRTPYRVIGTILPKPACDAEIEKAEPVAMKSNADPVKEIIVYKSRKRGLSTMTKNHSDRDAHLNEEVERGNTEISELLHNLCTSEVPNSDNSCDLEKLELQEDIVAEDHEIRDAAEKSTAHGVEGTLDLADSSSGTAHADHSDVLHVVPVSWEPNFDSSQSSSAYGSNGAVHSAGNSSAPDCSEVLLEIPVSWEPNCDGYFCNFERSDDQSVTPLSSPKNFEKQLRVAVPEERKMDTNATGASDHSVQNSTDKDYRSMVVYKYVRRNKRKREIENTTSGGHSSHAFVRGPCEGLRPRGARAEYEREEAKTVKNKIPVKKMKSKKNKGFSECDLEGCRMSFRTKEELLLHKRNRCTFKGCGKQFRSHHYTVRHQRVHDEERPLGCPWKGCRKSFKWGWARTEHVRLHTGERPYKCQVTGCGMAFRFMSEFSLHRRKSGHSVDSSAR